MPARSRPSCSASSAEMPSDAWDRLEAVLARFEDAWRRGERPAVEDYLRGIEAERRVLLIELVHEDLSYRLRAGEAAQVEDYLARFSELAAEPAILLDLIAAEYDLRRNRGEALAPEEYAGRFPEHADALRDRLAAPQADAEADRRTPTREPAEPMPALPDPGAATLPPGAQDTGPWGGPSQPTAGAGAAAGPLGLPGYEMLGRLGAGGMGVVYRARQLALGRLVALKMILHAEYADEEQRQRFRAEAEAVARLQHPNVVQVFEAGEYNGLPFFSMEFCPGGTLAAKLDGTPWASMFAAGLIETLARAVHAAHEAGVVHRDLKPANVLFASNGSPKVTDFGLAKRLEVEGHTQTGAVMGTPSYMAPEQAGGKSKDVGPAADVWALGVILYELVVGRPPFKAETPLDTILQVLSEEPVPVRRLQPKVHRDLETICHQCLQKDPKKRYTSALALAEDLHRFQAGQPVAARPVGAVGKAARWAKRRPAVAALLLAVAAVAMIGTGGILWSYGGMMRERNTARQAEGTAQQEAANARREADRADEQKREAQRQAYFAQIGRADAQLQAGDNEAAFGVLERLGLNAGGWEYRYLRRRAEGTPLTLCTRSGPVHSVSWSPDGSRIATACWDGTLRIWDARSGTEMLKILSARRNSMSALNPLAQGVLSVSWSPDGSRIAAASSNTAHVWNARSGAKLLAVRHAGLVHSVSWSPNGSRIATAGEDGTAWVCDSDNGAVQLILAGHTRSLHAVSWSPDGSRIATASLDNTARIWDAHSGTEILVLRGHGMVDVAAFMDDMRLSLSWSPDSSRIGTLLQDHTMRVWDTRTGAQILATDEHTDWVLSLSWSPDGSHIAVTMWDHTVRVLDARSGVEIVALRGHTDFARSVCWSPDGSRIATGSLDGTARVWRVRSVAKLFTLRGHTKEVTSVCWSPDGARIASASDDSTARVWLTSTGEELLVLRGHTNSVYSVCFSPDGSRIATGSCYETARIWDASSGAMVLALAHHGPPLTPDHCVCWSPDGSRIATRSSDPFIRIWDSHSGAEILTLSGGFHTGGGQTVSWSPDGERIAATVGGKITARVWDVRSGGKLLDLRGDSSLVGCICWSPDGSLIATASDQIIQIWDSHSGAEILNLRGHTSLVASVSWSPDGSRIATASGDSTVRIWDARSGTEILALRGDTGRMNTVSWSRDGSRIATGSADKTVRVWDGRMPHYTAGYDPWNEDEERRKLCAPTWHAEDAAAAEKRGDRFAALFHRHWLAEHRSAPLTLSAPMRDMREKKEGGNEHPSGPVMLSVPPGLLLVSSRGGKPQIYLVQADGTKATNLTSHDSTNTFPAWAPDGRRIAFASDRGGILCLYVMNADGSNVRRQTRDTEISRAPAWSPDGTKLVLDRPTPQGQRLYVISAEGGNPRLLDTGGGYDPAWSPDGRTILFASNRNHNALHLYVMRADGSGVKELTNTDTDGCVYPAWSPDGGKIAWTNRADAAGAGLEIFVANSDGRNATQVTHLGGLNTFTSWSPDGKMIAFHHSGGSQPAGYYIMGADGKGLRPLLLGQEHVEGGRPAWRPK